MNLREDQWTELGKLSEKTGATMSATRVDPLIALRYE
jgi:hypothetical protein